MNDSLHPIDARSTPGGTSPMAHVTRGLGLRYVSALVAVVALASLHQVVVQPALVRLNLYAPVINVAGRQRMLSQRLTKAALAIRTHPEGRDARVHELRETLADWTRAHNGLRDGDPQLDLPGTNSPVIRAAFDELQPHFEVMLAAGTSIVDGSTEPTPALDEDVETILRHETAYLPVMDRIVGLFEQEAREQVRWLQLMGLAIVFAILVLSVLVGWGVVRPATRLIVRQFARLSESETRYRSLVERMTDGLAVFRDGGTLEYVNDRLSTMLGVPPEDLVGRPLTAYASTADRPRLLAFLEGVDGPAPGDVLEVNWRCAGGESLCTLVAVGAMPVHVRLETDSDTNDVEPAPSARAYFAVVTDITDRKLAEDALRDARDVLEERVAERTSQLVETNEQLEREVLVRQAAQDRTRDLQHQLAHASRVTAIGELAAGIAHELNQPLGAIVNYAETSELLLQSEELDRPLIERAVGRTRDAAMRAGNIIRRMRRFVQGRGTERQLVDVNELVADVLELCDAEARRSDVVVETEFESIPPVHADGLAVQQVVVNLVQNAIQAMLAADREHRVLRVATSVDKTNTADAAFVTIRVSDTGPGFDGEPEAFFEPFHTTRVEGLGMGLAISRSIVLEHGGEMTPTSRPEGGAEVSFTLPVCTDAELPDARPEGPPTGEIAEDGHVLIG